MEDSRAIAKAVEEELRLPLSLSLVETGWRLFVILAAFCFDSSRDFLRQDRTGLDDDILKSLLPIEVENSFF